jgi:hypothetical protein
MFQQCTRLSFDTFCVLIRVVGLSLQQKNTNMRKNIPMEAIVVMVFARLSSGNSLQMCGEVYGIADTTTSIMKEFCVVMRKNLKPLVILKLTRNKIKKINIRFECLHEIPYIMGAIDGNHVLVIAPKVDPKSYCCQKGFYSTSIQGVVDAKCSF